MAMAAPSVRTGGRSPGPASPRPTGVASTRSRWPPSAGSWGRKFWLPGASRPSSSASITIAQGRDEPSRLSAEPLMKITLSSRRFLPPFSGGVDVYADRLARAFRRMGHQTALLAFDLQEAAAGPEVVVGKDEHQGLPVWRFVLTSVGRFESTFPYAYHKEMGESIRAVLQQERPDLLFVLSFYLSTLAAVEAAKDLGIPVAHIATDFVPICRRSTLIRWDGKACQKGESLKSCAACFVSHRPLGRWAARILDALPEPALLRFSERSGDGRSRGLSRPLNPYWKQVSLMRDRLRLLRPLRELIDKVFAPTRYTADAFLASGFRPDQVRLLPFAVEESSLLARIRRSAADHCRFLFIGRLQPYKGAHKIGRASCRERVEISVV